MLFPRLLEDEILRYLPEKEAIFILGARQAGKTTLMQLIKKGAEKEYPCFYFDLEVPQELERIESGVEDFLHYLDILGANRDKRNLVFIDEIQYLSNPARFIKLMVDHHSHRIKLLLSGSSSLDIRKKFKESLAGRKFVFHLYPLNFREFLIFKEKENLIKLLPEDPFEIANEEDKTRFFAAEYKDYFKEFLIFGGYPRAVLATDIEKKAKVLEEIATPFVLKDVRSLLQIEDVVKFNRMTKLLAINTGNLMNFSTLSAALGISRYLLSQYITLLENTYIITLLSPYFTNKKREVVKNQKVYFHDNGLRNYIVGDLHMTEERQDIGALLENAAFLGLKKRARIMEDIHFWRTQNKAEVDLILEKEGKIYPLEINKVGKPTRSLYSFMDIYKIKEGYVIYPGTYIKKGNIHFLPIWWIA